MCVDLTDAHNFSNARGQKNFVGCPQRLGRDQSLVDDDSRFLSTIHYRVSRDPFQNWSADRRRRQHPFVNAKQIGRGRLLVVLSVKDQPVVKAV